MASVLWRLRRATGIETALFESATEDSRKHENRPSRENLGEAAELADRNRLFLGAVPEFDVAAGNELSSNLKRDIANCFLRLTDMPTSALDRLSRYEHMLWRQARQIVFTLESLRRRKQQSNYSSLPFSFRRREPGALSEGVVWLLLSYNVMFLFGATFMQFLYFAGCGSNGSGRFNVASASALE